MAKKVKVCKRCSGFDVKELKYVLRTKDYSVGCIGRCNAFKCGEYKGKVIGMLNGEFKVCDTKEEFFDKIKEIIS